MNLKKGDYVNVAITDLAFGGAGVGKLAPKNNEDNFVVFVEGTAPGDCVSARLTKIKKQYAEAKLEKIVTPAPERIVPRCKHFGVCGGCSLQFLPYGEQLRWKEKIVIDALQRLGGFGKMPIGPIIGCENPWFYRNKMEYTFGIEGIIGLHPKKNFREIFDLQECFLQSPLSVKIAHAVAAWARQNNLRAFDAAKNEEFLKNLIIREGKNTGELLLNLVITSDDFPLEKAFSTFIAQEFPEVTSLYRTAVLVQKNKRTMIKEQLLMGKSMLTESLTVKTGKQSEEWLHAITLQFDILPQAFFQTNTKQAEVLYGKILEFAAPNENDEVLDLFCGTGTIGMFFSKYGCKKVVGVEMNEAAVESARRNVQKNKLSNIAFFCGDIEEILGQQEKSASLLITDPPRAGIFPRALQKILEQRFHRWIYVSCNPATLARDLQIACASGYTIKKIQPIDMFPQTYHIETVVLLTNE